MNGNGILTREALLALADNTEDHLIPSLGQSVRLRPASVDVFLQLPGKEMRETTELLIRSCLVDEFGAPIFTTETSGKIFQLPTKVVNEIMDAINRMNGWTKKENEDIEKNSQTLDDGSASLSPETLG